MGHERSRVAFDHRNTTRVIDGENAIRENLYQCIHSAMWPCEGEPEKRCTALVVTMRSVRSGSAMLGRLPLCNLRLLQASLWRAVRCLVDERVGFRQKILRERRITQKEALIVFLHVDRQ